MAPQAAAVTPPAMAHPSATSAPTGGNTSHKPFVPVALLIFLSLCLAYTFSYLLYRYIMAHRRGSQDVTPDSPDRGVSKFMNGARLTLNLGNHGNKFAPGTENAAKTPGSEYCEQKSVADTSHRTLLVLPDNPMSSPEATSTPIISRTPSRVQVPAPFYAPPTFPQRVAAKVKSLSKDRAEAIASDPKLAPVQGPLRPLSMHPSPTRKTRMRMLFGFGRKNADHNDPEKVLAV
ncbi:hypothetical protein PAXRUDRAFT_309945 [Paxillus rubicundulus Ve08.2h10]|uniref:Transmembrane protein n=1 Tax=Paxillus rubicundulus Ve08.2h10 TaxID=930991 RepID=A0A0D0DDH0_9AGAM|nr:hypothetical protein PAXRUDRAFT_309945 [Paxillus rubicundulus Ve08.2h10]